MTLGVVAVVSSSSSDSSSPPLPVYTRAEVAMHTSADTGGVWVTYGDGVYDVTEFIRQHPGGMDKIMLAAGGALEPFWRLYQQHLTPDGSEPIVLVAQFLAQYRVGTLAAGEAAVEVDASDPYAQDPARHPALRVLSAKPFNAEVPRAMLMENYVTPTDLWFVRHHHPVPVVDVDAYRLRVSGEQMKTVELSLHELREHFPQHQVTMTLQCAGNRRAEYATNDAGNGDVKVQGLLWDVGAISTGRFSGPRLRDVLAYAGLPVTDIDRIVGKHVQLIGTDAPFDASIPIEKGVSQRGDVILALDMNGAPLPADHGAPVRAIVPGHVAARNIKWLESVVVSDVESVSNWQRGAPYKGLGPNVTSFKGRDFARDLAVQELPVQSAIVEPSPASTHESVDAVTVRGFAWSGGGRGIARVDVSGDGGRTWQQAQLGDGSQQPPSRAWAWTWWETEVPVPVGFDGGMELCVKAVDASYNTQPERSEHIWNLRGILNNSWHRVPIRVSNKDDE